MLGDEKMNKLASKISDSEVEVMKVLWKAKGELTLTEIRTTLEDTSDWEASTIKTLLRRLCGKGVVESRKDKVFYYSANISEDEYNEYSTQSLIDRLYAGSAKKLVAALVGNKKLNKKDINELKNMFKVGDDNE